MLIDQALDATVLLSTLCLFNVVFTMGFLIAISFSRVAWRFEDQRQGPLRPSWILGLAVSDIVVGCLYPLVLLGVETFGPISRALTLSALGLGVALPAIILVLAVIAAARYRSKQAPHVVEQLASEHR